MTKILDEIMKKEVSRKEFLMLIGLSIASTLGFANVIRLLTGKSLDSHINGKRSKSYNANSYNG